MKICKSICLVAAMVILISGCGSAKTSTAPTNAYTPTLEVSAVVNGDAVTLTMTTDLKISKEHYDQQRVEGEGMCIFPR